ncbi:MAG: 3-deoxy-manno-octulosonate cytidylyltransferase, partial [Gammaproteobacteria bacterium]|nr:3-deoxy-manno-octulosonate cytidylyltransferase [Gammaproteobacteria bacterium]
VGIYAYRVRALRRFVALPRGTFETTESLEQLRFLENDIDIVVADAVAPVPGGVDTPADLERVRAVL